MSQPSILAGVLKGEARPAHLPIAKGAHSFHETALGLRALRQQLIAANIANADTPNYKAVDIDIEEALRIALKTVKAPPLTLATSVNSHMPGRASSHPPEIPLRHHVPGQLSADGNTVEMDVERAKFSENAVQYEFSLERASGHFKHLIELFRDLK